MKRHFLKALRLYVLPGAFLFIASLVIVLLFRLYMQGRTAARIQITSPDGVATLEKIKIGGVDQWIQIRGQNRDAPLLLFLHGGPGFPQMPFAHLTAELEKTYVIVQWDQRGIGKSYTPGLIPDSSMNIEQFVSDTIEMTHALLTRFGKSKCYLVAHSWGSMVGALAVSRHPELFQAYVSIGQLANLPETQQIRYQFAMDSAQGESNTAAVSELTKCGPPPYETLAGYAPMEKWVRLYAAREHQQPSPLRFFWLVFKSPAYSWNDSFNISSGYQYSRDHVWREIYEKANLFEQAPRIEVPVYFLLGRHDMVVTAKVAEDYFNALDAPAGKHLIWFENSGHWPHFEEPGKYCEVLNAIASDAVANNSHSPYTNPQDK